MTGASASPPAGQPVDPFDLPEAFGTSEVIWRADDGLDGARVRGCLHATGLPDAAGTPCDLLAVDDAYPAPVADDRTRLLAHQAWRHGQVHLASYDGRLTVVVPGTSFGPELVLDAVARFARSLGADPASYSVLLRLAS